MADELERLKRALAERYRVVSKNPIEPSQPKMRVTAVGGSATRLPYAAVRCALDAGLVAHVDQHRMNARGEPAMSAA